MLDNGKETVDAVMHRPGLGVYQSDFVSGSGNIQPTGGFLGEGLIGHSSVCVQHSGLHKPGTVRLAKRTFAVDD
jgi:hypothetical protein